MKKLKLGVILYICRVLCTCLFVFFPTAITNMAKRADSCDAYKKTYTKRVVLDGESSNYILSQDMLVSENTIYLIYCKFNIEGKNLNIPDNCILVFDGGCLCNGSITGVHSKISNASNSVIFDGINIKGSWSVSEISDYWFSFNPDEESHNALLNNLLALTDDDCLNVVHLDAVREYKVQDVYTGRIDLGTVIRPNYSKLHSDEMRPSHEIFQLKSNTKVILNNTIRLNPTPNGVYFMISMVDKHDIEICGTGAIYGDARTHLYITPFVRNSTYYGEWGHILLIRNCKNVVVRDITISDAFGDGIMVTHHVKNIQANKKDAPNAASRGVVDGPSKFITIDNVKVQYCRRNGIAGSAHHWTIKDCFFEGNGIEEIKGTAPRAAVDFENDYIKIAPQTSNQNTVMKNCVFKNNAHDISSTNNSPKGYNGFATIISSCKFTAPIRLNVTHNLLIKGCFIPRITSAINLFDAYASSHNLVFRDCIFEDLPPYLESMANSGGNKILKRYLY